MPLVTIAQFAGYLRRDLNDLDAYTAQLCLDGAAGLAVDYCEWHIAPSVTEDVTLDGSGTRIQPVPTLMLTELNAVTENGNAVDPDAVDWSANGILEKRSGGCWTRRRRGVVADITHGYDTTPSWVVTLICSAAARGFLTTPGVAAEAAGGESITYANSRGAGQPGMVALMDVEKRMLDRIRLPLVA